MKDRKTALRVAGVIAAVPLVFTFGVALWAKISLAGQEEVQRAFQPKIAALLKKPERGLELRNHLAEFTSPRLERTKSRTRRALPKILLINRRTSAILPSHWDLPDNIRADTPEQVKCIGLVDTSNWRIVVVEREGGIITSDFFYGESGVMTFVRGLFRSSDIERSAHILAHKTVFIDIAESRLHDLHFQVPDAVSAQKPEDVGTVVAVKPAGDSLHCEATDLATGRKIGERTFNNMDAALSAFSRWTPGAKVDSDLDVPNF